MPVVTVLKFTHSQTARRRSQRTRVRSLQPTALRSKAERALDYTGTAEEYRAILLNGTSSIWHGSVQVFASQSMSNALKSVYTNQNDGFVSNVSSNEFIII